MTRQATPAEVRAWAWHILRYTNRVTTEGDRHDFALLALAYLDQSEVDPTVDWSDFRRRFRVETFPDGSTGVRLLRAVER